MKLSEKEAGKKVFLGGVADFSSLGSPTAHVLLLLLSFTVGAFFAIQLALVLIITYLVVAGIKSFSSFLARPRGKHTFSSWLEKWDLSTRSSGHTASSFAIAFTVGMNTNAQLFAFLLVFACLVGYSRMLLKKHYFGNVFSGAIIGSLISILLQILFF